METMKLKKKLHENDTQDSDENFTDLPPTKKKRTKRNLMQMEGKKKISKPKPKNLKSKGKDACMGSSKKSKSGAYRRTRYADVYDNIEDKYSVTERAEKTLAHLENGLPYFVKPMLPSNVAHGFWLHLPAKWCTQYLPEEDASVLLVDEWGNEYKTSYLKGRHGLSAGWRGFAVTHRLLKGDVLIFHLTEPCKMKVHIVRVNSPEVMNAALCLMSFTASKRGTGSNVAKKDRRKRTKFVELPDLNIEVKNEENYIDETSACQSAINSDGFSAEGLVIGSGNAGRPQSSDHLCYSGPSFLRDHPRELLTCT